MSQPTPQAVSITSHHQPSTPTSPAQHHLTLFTLFDIILTLFGIYAHLFSPSLVLPGFTANATLPPAVETQLLLDAMAGFFALLAWLQISNLFLSKHDLAGQRKLQVGMVLIDLFMLWGFVRAMSAEGRLGGEWRGEDWGNIGGYVGIAVVRGAFVAGVADGGRERGLKRA